MEENMETIKNIEIMMTDIMDLKSFSQGEALFIALDFVKNGISPKSEEFYMCIDKCKTLWEV